MKKNDFKSLAAKLSLVAILMLAVSKIVVYLHLFDSFSGVLS